MDLRDVSERKQDRSKLGLTQHRSITAKYDGAKGERIPRSALEYRALAKYGR